MMPARGTTTRGRRGRGPPPRGKARPGPGGPGAGRGSPRSRGGGGPGTAAAGAAVGVDLGTTNSCVAVVGPGGRPRVVEVAGRRTVPSVVHFPEAADGRAQGAGGAGAVVVGAEALKRAAVAPHRTFLSTKRLLGLPFAAVDASGVAQGLPYRVVADAAGKAALQLGGAPVPGVSDARGVVAPERVAGYVLAELVRAAEAELGEAVDRAVVAVPAHFSAAQVAATVEAGRLAGLAQVKTIREPIAAALAYGVGLKQGRDELVLVYDLGGGTFDVSLLDVGGGTLEVRASGGDPCLGGDDFDAVLQRWLEAKALAPLGGRVAPQWRRSPQCHAAVAAAAEKLKIELSAQPEARARLPVLLADGRVEVAAPALKRAEFERLVEPLLRRSWMPVNEACWQGGIDLFKMADRAKRKKSKIAKVRDAAVAQEIDRVLLVGGATRMPAVGRFVKNMTGLRPEAPGRRVDPDEAVALGAALQAGILDGALPDLMVMDVWQSRLLRAFAEARDREEAEGEGEELEL